jgi:transposase-like protein
MTLKELQKQIERTEGKNLPTAAWLRAGNAPLAISRENTESGKLSVFVNGFALYEAFEKLTKGEQRLIYDLFFRNIGVREYARQMGVTHHSVQKRRDRILEKMRILMNWDLWRVAKSRFYWLISRKRKSRFRCSLKSEYTVLKYKTVIWSKSVVCRHDLICEIISSKISERTAERER